MFATSFEGIFTVRIEGKQDHYCKFQVQLLQGRMFSFLKIKIC